MEELLTLVIEVFFDNLKYFYKKDKQLFNKQYELLTKVFSLYKEVKPQDYLDLEERLTDLLLNLKESQSDECTKDVSKIDYNYTLGDK